MGPLSPDRRQLEDLWRERLHEALHRYREATRRLQAAVNDASDMPRPDGCFGVNQAQRNASMALAEYRRVLTIFNDLILDHKIPPEN